MKKILIIGGMGPQASLLLHQRLIEKAVEQGAINGEDFPDITHLSIPVPDFISDQTLMPQALKILRHKLDCLWPV
jgi:aspartate racemase